MLLLRLIDARRRAGVDEYDRRLAEGAGYRHRCAPPHKGSRGDTWECECGCPWILVPSGGGLRARTVSTSNPPWAGPLGTEEYWEEATGPLKWRFNGVAARGFQQDA